MSDGERVRVEAALFVTCLVDQFYPEVGESTVRVLRRLGTEVNFPPGQTCCGQTAFNSGFWSEARPMARRFLEIFRDASYIVTPSGSCASMVRVFYQDLLDGDRELLRQARDIGSRVYELSEFIVDVLGIKDPFDDEKPADRSVGVRVAYHESCHLRRELGTVVQPRTLISASPAVSLVEMEKADVCCGFGGTFSVKYPDISGAMLKDKVRSIEMSGANAVVACDSSCLMQIAGGLESQGVGVRPIHLAQLLDEGISI